MTETMNRPATRPNGATGKTQAEKDLAAALAKVAELEAKLTVKNTISFKVSEKGAVSVYGLQRMPVTLYAEQFIRLLEKADDIKGFIRANKSALSFK